MVRNHLWLSLRNSVYCVQLLLKLVVSQDLSQLEVGFYGQKTVAPCLVVWAYSLALSNDSATPILSAIELSPPSLRFY